MEREGKPISILKGYEFEFECEGRRIEAWFSAFSGLEKVLIDGQLVSSRRNFSKHSQSTFSIGSATCSTSLDVESLLKGPFVCTLFRNGEPFKRQRLVFPASTTSTNNFWYQIGIFVLLGIVLGVTHSYFSLPNWFFWVFIALVFAVSLYWSWGKPVKPYIEEEECD